MPTMYTTTYTDVYSGNLVSPAFSQYTGFNLTANVTLSWPTDFQNLNMVVSVNMDITPSAGGFTVTMPDATKIGTGFAFTINNPGAFSFSLLDSAAGLIITIPAGTSKNIWLISNATAAGTWRTFPNPGGGSAVTSVNAVSASNNLVITGVPIINAGTINFSLAGDLAVLSSFGGSIGIPFRTAANTWSLGQILGTDNQVAITNPSGTAGNPTIALSPAIKGLTSIEVGQFSLSGNTIASRNTDGAIILAPNGLGIIQLSKNTEILSGQYLKLYAANGTNYFSIKGGSSSVNQDLMLPTTAPTIGQVMAYTGPNQLGWSSIATLPGLSTTNAIPRYSNTGGSLKDSSTFLDDGSNMTGLTSCVIGNIAIGIGTSAIQTISTTQVNEDLIFEPNGTGATLCRSDVFVKPSALSQSSLKLFNLAGTKYAGLKASPTMALDALWTLPAAGATAGYFVTDASNVMSIRALPTPLVTVANVIPYYTDIVGTLGSSPLSVSGAGAITGASSITSPAALAIQATAGSSITLTTSGAGVINLNSATGISINNDTTLAAGKKVIFTNPAGTFATSVVSGAIGSNFTLTLPVSLPAATGILKVGTTGIISADSLGASAGILRTDGGGNVTINNITTAANQLAKYSDTVGTFAATGSSLDANNNLSLGTASIGTSATMSITLGAGVIASAVGAGLISISNADTGSGRVLSLYGGGNGGVSASTTNTNTNKIAIRVNGTFYYLLASTSST